MRTGQPVGWADEGAYLVRGCEDLCAHPGRVVAAVSRGEATPVVHTAACAIVGWSPRLCCQAVTSP
jgi:hypothetical protein